MSSRPTDGGDSAGVDQAAYRERAPIEVLRPFVVCAWTREPRSVAPDATVAARRILPDGCIDLVWDGRALVVAGPDTGPVDLEPADDSFVYAGVRFRPGTAPALLGVPSSSLLDQRVPLASLWGDAAVRPFVDRIATAGSAAVAASMLERALVERLDAPSDPVAIGAVRAIARDPSLRIDGLASRLGVTERTLLRRVRAGVGYGPQMLQRVVRFRRFLAVAHRRDDVGLAGLADIAGYADQAHLTRESRALAGQTPAELARAADVRLVQDGLGRPDAECEVPPNEETSS